MGQSQAKRGKRCPGRQDGVLVARRQGGFDFASDSAIFVAVLKGEQSVPMQSDVCIDRACIQ